MTNPIEYLQSKGFRITSDPTTYKSGVWGLRQLWQNGIYADAYCGGYHRAYDMSKKDGAAIPTLADGLVGYGTRKDGTFGAQVLVVYPQLGIQVICGHVKPNIPVKVGQKVKQGQTIAYQGNTNNIGDNKMPSHLHIQFQNIEALGEWEFTCLGINPLNIDIDKKPEKPKESKSTSNAMIVDISHHQPAKTIDYDTFAKHVDHVIVRTMDADMIDNDYKTHHKELNKRGVPTAAYAFVRGKQKSHMVNEAKMFYDRTKDLKPTMWWLDVETDLMQNSDMSAREGVSIYVNELRKLGVKKVGLYVAHHLYKQLNLNVDEFDAIWIPNYGTNNGKPSTKPSFPCDIHQYTSAGRLPGYSGDLDLNQIISDKKLEYFTDGKASKKKPTTPPADSNDKPDVKTYTVRSGDTLSGIAQKYNSTTKKLQDLNNISNPDKIFVGQVIKVVGTASKNVTTYKVKSGDTLSGIASKFGTTTAALQNANNIANANKIYVGQVINVSGKAKSSSKKYHTVKSGDTVSGLAQKYGSSQDNIVSWNKLKNADTIFIGQKLRVK